MGEPLRPDLSVIVLNYNGRSFLPGCLDALASQVGAPPFEVILVDNASADGSAEFVRSHYPGVRVLETGANLGFAAGNNAGARTARGRALVFLNNDTIPASDWLVRLHAALSDRPEFGLATSRLVTMDDENALDSAGDGYFHAGGAFKHGHGGAAARHLVSREVFGACGAAFAIKREIFEALGGFDKSFFMVYEDVDLSYRARLGGHRVWYAADAIVRHAGSGTLGVASPAAVYYGQRNLEWTWIKNTPVPLLWRTAVPHAIYSLAGLAYYARRGRLWPALRAKLAALAGLPRVLRTRRAVQRSAVASPASVEALMERRWLAAKRREKRAL
ncbi:glycosyltransferase family 2 protein [soil metagenome]|nr:glycosyltransferase family 2 protein [Acidobacteriota bacterium]